MRLPTNQMAEKLEISPYIGSGAYGPTFGKSYKLAAYIEPGAKQTAGRDGGEVTASLFAIVPWDSSIGVGDRAVYDRREYETIEVQPIRPNGVVHHIEVYFRSASE